MLFLSVSGNNTSTNIGINTSANINADTHLYGLQSLHQQ
jgi:hypothetical protein